MLNIGTVSAMVSSLKNNNALLSKRKGLKRLRENLDRRNAPERGIIDKKISAIELAAVKADIIRQFKRERLRNNIIISLLFGILLSALIVGISFLFNAYVPKEAENLALQMESERIARQKQNEKFNFYLTDGYKWLDKDHFINALFQFELATKTRPNSYDAQFALTQALLAQCSKGQIDCEAAINQYKIMLSIVEQKSLAAKRTQEYTLAMRDTSLTNRLRGIAY